MRNTSVYTLFIYLVMGFGFGGMACGEISSEGEELALLQMDLTSDLETPTEPVSETITLPVGIQKVMVTIEKISIHRAGKCDSGSGQKEGKGSKEGAQDGSGQGTGDGNGDGSCDQSGSQDREGSGSGQGDGNGKEKGKGNGQGSGKGAEWIVLSSVTRQIDLIALSAGINNELGLFELPACRYTQIRLTVSNAYFVKDGVEIPLVVPSGVIKLTHAFILVAGSVTTLTLDFNAETAIQENEAGEYILKPRIHVNQDEA